MVADDALKAAKEAALQTLTLNDYSSTTSSNQHQPQSNRARRRRSKKRKRQQQQQQQHDHDDNTAASSHNTNNLNANGGENDGEIAADVSDEDVSVLKITYDYTPESATNIVKNASSFVSNEDAAQLLDALSRFEQRADTNVDMSMIEDNSNVQRDNESVRNVMFKKHDADNGTKNKHDQRILERPSEEEREEKINDDNKNKNNNDGDGDDDDENENSAKGMQTKGSTDTMGLSRKKWKEERRNLISKLKAVVPDPSVVEAWDVTCVDPVLQATLKSVRNSVSVPLNWRQKRKYLQNKRGLEKRSINLPLYIESLGIGVTRDSQRESDSKKTLKQKQREKMRAKLSVQINDDLDEQRLHDAFFKYQTKPRLTPLGDLYYELRELEVDPSVFTPGVLSDSLRESLGIEKTDPPPWIVGMQRWGPPPGWPGLSLPGVNAPIPVNAKYGYAQGEWGRPPVDEFGLPLYGDVFSQGIVRGQMDRRFDVSDVAKTWTWGKIREVEDEDNLDNTGKRKDNIDDEDEDEENQNDQDMQTNARNEEMQKEKNINPSGTEERINYNNNSRTTDSYNRRDYGNSKQGKAYRVLPERRAAIGNSTMLGSSHTYEMNTNVGRESGGGQGTKRAREELIADHPNNNKKRSNNSNNNDDKPFKF